MLIEWFPPYTNIRDVITVFSFSPPFVELTDQLCKVAKERDQAVKESGQSMEDLKSMYEEDIKKLQEKLRKELSSRDRQIESLEEQLQHSTTIEIKKLKRGSAARHVASEAVVIEHSTE